MVEGCLAANSTRSKAKRRVREKSNRKEGRNTFTTAQARGTDAEHGRENRGLPAFHHFGLLSSSFYEYYIVSTAVCVCKWRLVLWFELFDTF